MNTIRSIAIWLLIILAIVWILTMLTGCASVKQVSCYQPPNEHPIYQGEVRVIDKTHFLESNGKLKTINGICLHDNPGFWTRATGGVFDSLERGQ